MAHVAAFGDWMNRRQLRRERVFRDRENPIEMYNDQQLVDRYRFDRRSILDILQITEARLVQDTVRSHAIPPLLQLTIALRFFACGSFILVVGDTLPIISKATVSRCVRRVSLALHRLIPALVRMPTGRRLNTGKRDFFIIAGFPNVIGAVDCTHINIVAPIGEREPDFVNRKGQHSLNVQMVCDGNLLITNAVVNWPGSVHDSRIFRESALGVQLAQGPNVGYLLGDSGYPCRPFLLTPFADPNREQAAYQRAHILTRLKVEQMFGVLKSRFRCLKYLRLTPERAVVVIGACVVLHNIATLRRLIWHVRQQNIDQLQYAPDNRDVQDGFAVRDHVAHTFFH